MSAIFKKQQIVKPNFLPNFGQLQAPATPKAQKILKRSPTQKILQLLGFLSFANGNFTLFTI
jgi:hypothetical protein